MENSDLLGRSSLRSIHNLVIRDSGRIQDYGSSQTLDRNAGEPDAAEIWSAVERVLKSRALRGSNRLIELLNFVVSETLRGEATQLKETTIAVSVFKRSPDYDPKLDTIVRSQAWRLRAKLKKYYATEGADDPIVIELPIGHYVPVFHARHEAKLSH